MDITLETDEVWRFDFEFDPVVFLAAASSLLTPGDVAVFGAYEPTPKLLHALTRLGATPRSDIPGLFTCFDANRSEHPNGTAFEYVIADSGFADILRLGPAILRQTDIPSFFDHFVAYRPGPPRQPLMSYHDAACGGTLSISGDYSQESAAAFAAHLSAKVVRAKNPVLRTQA